MIDFNKKTPYEKYSHSEFKEFVASCQDCDLSKERTQTVFSSGNNNAHIMIIGEGPGQQEDEEGVPFVGRSGQLLTKIMESVDICRDDVYIANTVKCRPPNNRTPTPSELTACEDYLIRQVQLVQPRIILLLGAAALRCVLGNEHKITKVRGKWFTQSVQYMEDYLYIMPMFHPSYLLRNASKEKGAPKWLTWQDMKEVKAAVSFYDIISTS